jgi:tetratricopeptide (TPR) repeat protein
MRFVISFLFILTGFIPAFTQRNKIDSLRSTLARASNDTVRVNISVELARLYRRINFDSVYYFGMEARKLSQDINYKRGEAGGNLMMGIGRLRRGDLLDAMSLCERALELSVAGNFPEIESEALNNIGLNYNYQGDYPTALEYYQRALSVAESMKNKSAIAGILTNIGGIYYNLKDYNRSLDYWHKALQIHRQLNDIAAAATCMSNIGLAYSDKGDYQMALKYYFQSLSNYERNSLCPRIYPLENIGSTYYKMGKLDSAGFYLQTALEGAVECHNPVAELGILNVLADVSKSKKQFAQALQYLNRAYKIGDDAGLKRETSIVAKSLSEFHEMMGNTKEAFAVFKTYQALRDSIYNGDNAKAIGRLEAKYEYDSAKRAHEIARQIENLEKEKLLAREKWIRNTFIAGFILMICIAGLIYRNFERKKISNRHLELLNKEIKEHEKVLISQSEELKMLNESLSELNTDLEKKVAERTRQLIEQNMELENKNEKLADYAFINAHKLRAPVATILGLVKLFEVDIEERGYIVERIKHSTEDLNDIVKEIRITLEKEKARDE